VVRTASTDAHEWDARPFCAPKCESSPCPRARRTHERGRRTASPSMIRLICPHCNVPFLRVMPAEDDAEEIVCPHCGRSFVPEEEEWVDPEDE